MDNTGYTPEEPIAAIATALSPSALGIVRCSGKNCLPLLAKVFSRPQKLVEAEGNSIVYGWIKDGVQKIDEVLVSVFRAPRSFTGEEMAEISCHGGVNVVMAVYNLLLKNGFRPAERGEFTFRSYINGKTDLTKAEAIREIIDSKTDSGRSHAAGRLSGSLYDTIDSIKKLIVDTLAAIEVEIEYPEDEETISDTFDPGELKKASLMLEELAESWKSEKIYQDGSRVVLCGRTNAGKSSLFNAILKEERAIVSDIEGTTRDWIESWADFDGVPVRLFDTAGIRETSDEIEARGVELTRDLSREADVVLYLVDSSDEIREEDLNFLRSNELPVIVVLNKCDKISPEGNLEKIKSYPSVKVSAKSGEGIGELCTAVKNIICKGTSSERTGTGLGSERQKIAVEEALACVNHALELTKDYTLDAVVQDLEDSLDSLGNITGDVTPDDVLGSIFEHFCVGK
ncbi:MAG: tRNA uridine-5-carboxymethylaminomethyl(34) synthesis GTPase MnmE [Treponema sp.]|nr:tRNA uridine-5-carboxymethylaminomethyl(34) synthesis GTPase MnmE [Treponema sp.]